MKIRIKINNPNPFPPKDHRDNKQYSVGDVIEVELKQLTVKIDEYNEWWSLGGEGYEIVSEPEKPALDVTEEPKKEQVIFEHHLEDVEDEAPEPKVYSIRELLGQDIKSIEFK